MKYGRRTHKGASLYIGVAKSLPVPMRASVVELSSLFTEPEQRKQGQASKLLLDTGLEADAAGKVLLIAVDDPALVRWYNRFGFAAIQQAPLLMARPVNG